MISAQTLGLSLAISQCVGFQWNVAERLESLGLKFQMECEAEDFPLDIVVDGHKVAIEVYLDKFIFSHGQFGLNCISTPAIMLIEAYLRYPE